MKIQEPCTHFVHGEAMCSDYTMTQCVFTSLVSRFFFKMPPVSKTGSSPTLWLDVMLRIGNQRYSVTLKDSLNQTA